MLYKVMSHNSDIVYLVEATESFYAQKNVREYTKDNSFCVSQTLEVNEDVSSYVKLTDSILKEGK